MIKEPLQRGEVSMDTNDISPGKPNKYFYLLPTYAQKDSFVFYRESYVYEVSGIPTPSGKPRPYLTEIAGLLKTKKMKKKMKKKTGDREIAYGQILAPRRKFVG